MNQVRMNTTGTVLAWVMHFGVASAGVEFPVAAGPQLEASISVASDGTNYLVGVLGTANDSDGIAAQLVSPSGALLGPLITTSLGGAPLIAFGGSNYLMVWEDCDTPCSDDVRGQFISPAGVVSGPSFTVTDGPIEELLGVAFGGSTFLVSYTRELDQMTSDSKVFAHLVATDGTVGSEIEVSAGFGDHVINNVAFGGGSFLVIWVDDDNDTDVRGRFIATDGTPGTEFSINASGAISDNPASVIFAGGNFWVIFSDELTPETDDFDLFGQRLSTSGAPVGGVFSIANGQGSQAIPFLATNGDDILVTWSDLGAVGGFQVFGRFFNTSGTALGGEIAISSGPQAHLLSPVASDGANYLVAYTEGTSFAGGNVVGRILGGGGVAQPKARDETFQMLEGDTLSRDVITNDDLGTGLGTVNLVTDVGNGLLVLASDGGFDYTPDGAGTDSFEYSISDSAGNTSNTATVTINVLVDLSIAQIVVIDPAGPLDDQVDDAITMANSGPRTVRIQFPPGTYAYATGMQDGHFADPITGSVVLEAQVPSSTVVIQGLGTGNGGWLAVTDGTAEIRGLTIQDFSAPGVSGAGAVRVGQGGKLSVSGAEFSGNSSSNVGGAIHGQAGSRVIVEKTVFSNNMADQTGGAIHLDSGSTMHIVGGEFSGNSSTEGGAIHLQDPTSPGSGTCTAGQCTLNVEINDSTFSGNDADRGGAIGMDVANGSSLDKIRINKGIFVDNSAQASGCDVMIQDTRSQSNESAIVVRDSTFSGACSSTRIDSPSGSFTLTDSTVVHDGNAIDAMGEVSLGGTVLVESSLVGGGKGSAVASKDACNFGELAMLKSLGANINSDISCNLDQPTDQPGTDPMVMPAPDRPGKFDLLPISPAVDAAFDVLRDLLAESKSLPCGYKDANGLGRPQDGNGDGAFECDIGHTELKGGDDIAAPQSSAYFDTSRNGEGVFVEMLGGDLAFVAMFTYPPAGEGMAWFVGIGNVVGNSLVMDEMLVTSGGVFGADFDPTRILRTSVGGMSMNFPTCEASTRPGRLAFQAALNSGYQDLLVFATRLSSILSCQGGTPSQTSGRSGSFYDLNRDGEGIFVQWLDDGRVLVIWYTYDPEGNQFWIISGDATVDGNTVTANMLYPAGTTVFGEDFTVSDVLLDEWGQVVLEYLDCNRIAFSYSSELEGFGSGSYNYVRLTSLAGTTCDL